MQGKASPNGGFSLAKLADLIHPMPKGDYSPEKINVAQQQRDPGSMLNWMERLIRRRRETPEFGLGEYKVLDVGARAVFAHSCTWDGREVIALHNFSSRSQDLTLDSQLGDDIVELSDNWSDTPYAPISDGRTRLQPYGYRWVRVIRKGQELLL